MLLSVPDAERALAEMVRIVRLGGRVAVIDYDFDPLVVDHPDKVTTRTIARTYPDAFPHGWIGRQLPRLFKGNALIEASADTIPVFNVDCTFVEMAMGGHCTRAQTDGILTPAQARAWWEQLREAEERGVFLLEVTSFVVAGIKPGDV